MFTISIPAECVTYIDFGGVPSNADRPYVNVARKRGEPRSERRRPNNWMWQNKKEYQKFWYKENRDHVIKRALESYYRNK